MQTRTPVAVMSGSPKQRLPSTPQAAMADHDTLPPSATTLDLGSLFDLAASTNGTAEVQGSLFARSRLVLPGGAEFLVDSFGPRDEVRCLFLRVPASDTEEQEFLLPNADRIMACSAGGWLIQGTGPDGPLAYWIPRPPAHRSYDDRLRVLADEEAPLSGFTCDTRGVSVRLHHRAGLALECVVWQFPPAAQGLVAELQGRSAVESTAVFLWSSQTNVRSPAEIYLHLLGGRVYQNARAWPRKWKFCCELDAYEIFVWLSGLRRATGKRIYDLLRLQLLLSVIARQSPDGAWYHGEWTDQFECHYRFHTGALLLLENALDEWDEPIARDSLERGARFVSAQTDQTDLGLWFLHDSLEASVEAQNEMFRQTGTIAKGFGAWKPSRVLGKSLPNKVILNTHVDTTVALDRFARASADAKTSELVTSAVESTRRLLDLRPAGSIYGPLYRAVKLTMLPAARGAALPLPVRAFKRLVWMYLLPNLYRLKRAMPRMVMPGGYIDRHLAPLHFDGKYHAVNVLDLVRLWRRIPAQDLHEVVQGGIDFVLSDGQATLLWWAEAHPRRFAIVVFAEALFHLCMFKPDRAYRDQLAQVVLVAQDAGLAMPPSILGGNAEITPVKNQVGCPSPTDPRLIVINLGTTDRSELLVVNPTRSTIGLHWENNTRPPLCWTDAKGTPADDARGIAVAGRGWLLGLGIDGR